MRFINDDVKLKVGGRKAARITQEELWNMILRRALLLDEDEDYSEMFGEAVYPEDGEAMYRALEILHTCDNNIADGNKFGADVENLLIGTNGDFCEYEDDEGDIGQHLMGLQTLHNGLTFYGYMAGGDWECPVYIIIYYDGKKLRAYTPSYGNCVNLDCHTAFGSEGNAEKEINYEKLEKKYIKNGWNIDEDGEELDPDDDDFLYTCYLNKYGLTYSTLGFNWDAIRQDIESRIEVDATPCKNPTVDTKNPVPKASNREKQVETWMNDVFTNYMRYVTGNPTKKATLVLSKDAKEVARVNVDFERQRFVVTGKIPSALKDWVDDETGECIVQSPAELAPMLSVAKTYDVVLEDDPNHRPLQVQRGAETLLTDSMKDMLVAFQTWMKVGQEYPDKTVVLQMNLKGGHQSQLVKTQSTILLRGFIPIELRHCIGFLGTLQCSDAELIMTAFAHLLESYEIGELNII